MLRETYKGRRLKAVKNGDAGGTVGSVNGQPAPTRYGVPEREVIEQLRSEIDIVDQSPVDSALGAYWYAPGSYELCEQGHPKDIGGTCRHSYCQEAAAAADRRR